MWRRRSDILESDILRLSPARRERHHMLQCSNKSNKIGNIVKRVNRQEQKQPPPKRKEKNENESTEYGGCVYEEFGIITVGFKMLMIDSSKDTKSCSIIRKKTRCVLK